MLAFSAEALRLCAESSAQAHCRPALDNAPELGNGCSWCAGGVFGVPRACSRRPATTWHSVPLELPGLLLKTNRRTLLKHGFIFNIWPGTPGVVVEHSSASDNGRATVLPRLSVSSKPGTCPRGESIRRVINQGRHFLLGHLAGGGGVSQLPGGWQRRCQRRNLSSSSRGPLRKASLPLPPQLGTVVKSGFYMGKWDIEARTPNGRFPVQSTMKKQSKLTQGFGRTENNWEDRGNDQ